MSDPFAVLAENIRNLVEGRVVDVEAMREALEAIQQERDNLLTHAATYDTNSRVNAHASDTWQKRAEAAERKLAALREAAQLAEEGYDIRKRETELGAHEIWDAADQLVLDALRVALEGEAG